MAQSNLHLRSWKPDQRITEELTEFVDEKNMNFELKENAKTFEAIPGFEPIPFSRTEIKNRGRKNILRKV
jgi:hypothetical protein